MSSSHKTRRGTAIVETEQGILLVKNGSGTILLPGGRAENHESRFEAAIRELREETGLLAFCALSLFEYASRSNDHRVVWILASGEPRPFDDAVALDYCRQDAIADSNMLLQQQEKFSLASGSISKNIKHCLQR